MNPKLHRLLIVAIGTLFAPVNSVGLAAPPKLPHGSPESVGMDAERLAEIDTVIAEALRDKKMPGCVVLVARRGVVVWLKAYGNRRVEPMAEPMTTDTVFDMASITKPTATATSIMLLVEQGKLSLQDTAAKHWPEFAVHGKHAITIEQLLTHQSGLLADNSLKDYADGPHAAMDKVANLQLQAAPGTKFIYSDVGYIVLAEIVRRISGQDVHAFTQQHVFGPLAMTETTYLPPDQLKARAAPTEKRNDQWMQGEVHDPRAYELGGVAGHAGLFSTAENMAVYGQMLLRWGTYANVQVMQRSTIEEMIKPRTVPGGGRRALGWDIKTGYSSNRGEGFSGRAFGHGGFTGTTFWVDPELELCVIFLSNRLHPNGLGAVNPLAGRIGGIAAKAIAE